ncbi:MAG: tail collar protein [Tardiphaga sp.]|nr:tail collar protein [Tardiphaga sp.]
MSDPYVGEIRLFGFPRVPIGWLACNGAALPISQYDVLFTLIGTTYGGNGTTTFCTPDLRGRVPLHQGTGGGLSQRVIGQSGGEESHTLQLTEMPSHGHALLSTTNPGTTATPGTSVHLAASSAATTELYAPVADVPSYNVMAPSITSTGNNLAHDNMMPTLACNFCICWAGIFPSQS